METSRKPARRSVRQQPRRRLLVVCEGQVTEPEYLRGYLRHVRNHAVEVVMARERGDPLRIVQIAAERLRRARQAVERTGDPFRGFDEVWCVFDRDEHFRFDDAVFEATERGFSLAVSNPCFELWMLLHHRESPGTCHRFTVQRMLRVAVPGQGKHVRFDRYAGGVEQAELRAAALDEAARRRRDPMRNPTTGFYRLTQSIRRRS